jgi:hypothetical protein
MTMPPYQWPPPNYVWVPREHPQGTVVLVLGIMSLAVCQLAGPFAWVMGYRALQEIDANPTAYSNRSSVLIGYICGIVATGLMVLSLVVVIAVIGVAIASS